MSAIELHRILLCHTRKLSMPHAIRRISLVAMLCLSPCLPAFAGLPAQSAGPAASIDLAAAAWASGKAEITVSSEDEKQIVRIAPRLPSNYVGVASVEVDKSALGGRVWRFRAEVSSSTAFKVQTEVIRSFAHIARPTYFTGRPKDGIAEAKVFVDLPFYVPADATKVVLRLEFNQAQPGNPLTIQNPILQAITPVDVPRGAAADFDNALSMIKSSAWRADSVNWPAVETLAYELLGRAPSTESRRLALAFVLHALADGHSGLTFPSTYPAASLAPSTPTVSIPSPRAAAFKREAISAGYYLKPEWMPTRTLEDRLDYSARLAGALTSAADSTCGWVIDLRRNSGSNLYAALDGLWHLFGDGPMGQILSPMRNSSWRFEGGTSRGDRTEQGWVNAGPARFRHSPVAVLIDDFTAGSTEALVMSFIGRERTRLFGSRTSGSTVTLRHLQINEHLAFNWVDALTADRSGRTYLLGIDPDVVVSMPAAFAGKGPVRQQAEAWLDQQCGVRK
ncbi:S41 family peptidase [Paucibacter sp. JuS9]|uniref:S41 family peptidase n=1 Tax=Paucibacter sp. JuS9 TaxID=3228748 RepID=UPI003757C124